MATTEVLGAAGMTNEQKTFYSKQLLARLVPALEHANHGLAEDIPPHAGKVIEKRRFESYNANVTALTEGTPILTSAINGTWTALPFTIQQYGAFALVSDVLTQQGFDGSYILPCREMPSVNFLKTLKLHNGLECAKLVFN
jgi:N4-gp56 family major capsid protein